MGAVRAVRDGLPLYTYAAENGDPFTHPPFALLVFWPMGALPETLVQGAWTAATVLAVVVIAAALTARQHIHGRQRFVVVVLAAATVLLASAPVQSNLRFGQVSVFIVLLALVDALGLLPRRRCGRCSVTSGMTTPRPATSRWATAALMRDSGRASPS